MIADERFFARKEHELGVKLSDVQRQAVRQTEGPLLLLASPGSGKTTTIIMRIGYLILEKGIDPARVKAVTFSRASAHDMKERFRRFFPELAPVDFSTIHSLAFEVVREHLRARRMTYRIIEGNVDLEEADGTGEDDLPLHKRIIVRQLYKSIAGENITDDQLDELTTYISYIKNKMLPSDQLSQVQVGVKQAARIYREYEAYKQSGHRDLLLDYDDMLVLCEQALASDGRMLRKYQERYDYVLTDESQDTSLVQHAIIDKLARRHANLCVVADDDQSLYSWRGAEPSYLLNFQETYPQAVTMYMEQNYRSSRDIVDVANVFIKQNKRRYDKNMFTMNEPCEPIRIMSFADYASQAKHVVKELAQVDKLHEAAVLYRNNSSSVALINELDRAGIPFYMKDADNRFFSHWVVEDVLNFMRIAFTDKRPDLLATIHTKFNGYITKQQMSALLAIGNKESIFDNLLNYVPLQDYQVKQLTECKRIFGQMRDMPPLHAIRVIRDRLGYEKALEKMCERLGFRKEYLIGILNTLESIADSLDSLPAFAARLKHLEAELRSAKSRRGQHAVTLSTLHSSKGLEFERVYMVDLIDGIIPSSDDRGSSERMEEARRLFYVGMTRAKSRLELIVYRERDGEKVSESRFVGDVRRIMNPPKQAVSEGPKVAAIEEIPHNPNAYRDKRDLVTGASVKHRVFGTGEITRIDAERVHIRFSTGDKALAIAVCLERGLLEPGGGT